MTRRLHIDLLRVSSAY
ncbi:putative leader peptide [Streptomyces sp. LN549]